MEGEAATWLAFKTGPGLPTRPILPLHRTVALGSKAMATPT
jgi:hypothetical protein